MDERAQEGKKNIQSNYAIASISHAGIPVNSFAKVLLIAYKYDIIYLVL